jgi:iron complex outermembrane receptor protein
MRRPLLLFPLFCGLILAHTPAVWAQRDHDQAIELVEVSAQRTRADAQLFSESAVTRPTHDAGELLRSVTGMQALRRGGRGFDPIIRGQSQSNLNVVANGAYNFGACPGRMDPPSTYIGVESFDRVAVIKGHRSVIHGPGGSGGTLLFEHERPQLGERGVSGSLTTGYTGNSDLRSLSGDVAAGNDRGYLRVFAASKRADDYEDGDGRQVASRFDSDSLGLVAGIELGSRGDLQLSHERSAEEDIAYAGNGMDGDYADSRSTSLRWRQQDLGPLDGLELSVYRSDVEHLMDTYSVRDRSPVPMGMAAPSSSDTWGGRLLASWQRGAVEWRLGADYRVNEQGATLYSDQGKDGIYDALVSRMWPDVRHRHRGVFAELDYAASAVDSLRLGLRWDDHASEARGSALPAGMQGMATPERLYASFYGSAAGQQDDAGLSVVLGWDRQLDSALLFSANLSSTLRMPDSSERWMARQTPMGAWVGNPALEPERHQQIDLRLERGDVALGWALSVFADQVDDYIERYREGSTDLYRNTDALRHGLELDGHWSLNDALSARAGLSWTRGESDREDLAQIAPLELRLNLDYRRDDWAVGLEWLVADRQTHFNPAVDAEGPTPGFSVLHLYGHYSLATDLTLELGVENLFDRSYAYHVNAGNQDPFEPTALRVNEPGRQAWVRLRYAFGH